jgi:hypothetical protein
MTSASSFVITGSSLNGPLFFPSVRIQKARFASIGDKPEAIAFHGRLAARRTKSGMEVELKLPWKNFPEFTAKTGEVIAGDAELCYSDGGPRVDGYFAYGSPLSVQQPITRRLG